MKKNCKSNAKIMFIVGKTGTTRCPMIQYGCKKHTAPKVSHSPRILTIGLSRWTTRKTMAAMTRAVHTLTKARKKTPMLSSLGGLGGALYAVMTSAMTIVVTLEEWDVEGVLELSCPCMHYIHSNV
jgi:hypothetical protein